MLSINHQQSLLRGNSVIISMVFFLLIGLNTRGWATPTSLPVTATPYNTALSATNGNKSVVAPDGTFHMVYVYGGQVKYTATANAVNWTPPITISGNIATAQEPTIAVAAHGSSWVIGVAFVDGTNGVPYYTFKAVSSAIWSLPVPVANNQYGSASEPSMVGYGEEMYLTWVNAPFTIIYAKFPGIPANSPIVNWVEWVQDLCLCGASINVAHPSIAVTRTGPNDDTPIVRIGYFYFNNGSYINQSYSPTLKVVVAQRPEGSAGPVWPYETLEWATETNFNQNNFQDYSLSLAANPLTGDFYLAYSYYLSTNPTGVTKLAYDKAWSTSHWQKQQTILPRLSQIDVASTASTAASARQIRIAVNDLTLGSGKSGPVWYQTGQWFDNVGLAWQGSSVKAFYTGRDPQAIFWTRNCQSKNGVIYLNDYWREIFAIFTAPAGSGLAVYEALDGGSCWDPVNNPTSVN